MTSSDVVRNNNAMSRDKNGAFSSQRTEWTRAASNGPDYPVNSYLSIDHQQPPKWSRFAVIVDVGIGVAAAKALPP